MKKISILAAAMILALDVSVCSAQALDQTAGAAGVRCKDGVCEFVPVGSNEKTALAAANPYNNAVPDIEGEWEKDVKQLGPQDRKSVV